MATVCLKYYSFDGRISLKLPNTTCQLFSYPFPSAIRSLLQMINESPGSIAIADNHQLIRQTLIQVLTSFGYHVIIEAENGKSLIEKLEEDELPDICVIDLEMPVLDGYETTEYIKQNWPSIKVLIFSLDNNMHNQQRALDCGADAFISKLEGIELLKEELERLKNSL